MQTSKIETAIAIYAYKTILLLEYHNLTPHIYEIIRIFSHRYNETITHNF